MPILPDSFFGLESQPSRKLVSRKDPEMQGAKTAGKSRLIEEIRPTRSCVGRGDARGEAMLFWSCLRKGIVQVFNLPINLQLFL